MDQVNNVLNRVMRSLGLDRRLREHTFVSLWPTFVSGVLAERSRPIFIDAERNLVVSVADAATGQELSMMRSRLLPKLMPAARSLGVEIRGMRLDMKHFHAGKSDKIAQDNEEKPRPKPSEADLAAVTLAESDKMQLIQLQEELAADQTMSDKLRGRILHVFELELRLKRYQLRNGFPLCDLCGNPAERLHRRSLQSTTGMGRGADKGEAVCLTCVYA